jgi:hypothetical protein
MIKKLHIVFILFCLSFFTACGDLFMKESSDKEITLPQAATCELDMDAFSLILEKNIKGDIVCLKDKLSLFLEIVETDRPGFLSKTILKDFLLTGPIDVDPEIIDIIDSVFDLSYLIVGSDRSYINKSEMDQLLEFLIYFNQNIWKTNGYFNSDDDINYSRHSLEREQVYNDVSLISNRLISIFKKNRPSLDRIDTEQFIYNFFKNDPDVLEKIRSIIFAKRVFLGGQKWDLTHVELGNALEILPSLIQSTFDMAKISNYTFTDDQDTMIKLFKKDVKVLRNIIYYDEGSPEAIFSVFDLIHALDILAPDVVDVDFSKYPKEIMKIKDIFLGDGGEFFSSRELFTLLDHADRIFDEANLFYRVYDFYADELNSGAPISHDFSGFSVNTSLEKFYLNEFASIANNYKFIKGSFESPYYTKEYHRNANAFFQTLVLEYGIKNIMAYYGQRNPGARGGYDLTLDQTYNIVSDFKWFLKDNGIVTIGKVDGGELQGVTDNFVLLSTLFQYQSDGCDTETVCMEVPEVTEFVTGLITAIGLKDFFTEKVIDLCRNELDEYDRINPSCFRRNFINVLEEPIPGDGRALSEYMPLFHSYLKDLVKDVDPARPITDSKPYVHFLRETEGFTRTCEFYDDAKTEEVPMKDTDAFAIFAGLLNVESTVLRFDADGNNKLDYNNEYGRNEVMTAYYEVYEGAIQALVAPDGGFMKKLSKPIYKYLIKHGNVPDVKNFKSVWRFVKFLLKRRKNADATRATIATVLKVIGQQNDDGLHPFKCEECLRDPTIECTPEGDEWND